MGERSDLPQPPTGNVLLDLLAGATIHLCTPDGYRERDARMAELADELRSQGAVPYVIPEGGSNALGAMGYVEAARELIEQTREQPPTSVIVATGSGGTLAGLAQLQETYWTSHTAYIYANAYMHIYKYTPVAAGCNSFVFGRNSCNTLLY